MDPATIAARAFIDDAERVWRAGRSRVLRATAPEADRGALVKVLRRMEWSPGNRRPLFLYDAPFRDPDAWCEGLGASLRRDYEAVREGARAQGVTLANGGAVLGIQIDDLVYQRQLGILKLLFNVLLDLIGVLTHKTNIQHDSKSFPLFVILQMPEI